MKNLSLYKSNVLLSDNRIEDYDKLLSRFSNWKSYKREINLNILLESNKKIEFKVDIENQSFGGMYISIDENIETPDILLQNVCAVIKCLTFIIKESVVIDLEVEYKVIDTEKGKILLNLLKDLDLDLLQKRLDNEIIGFYFNLPKKAA
jgi:hypothetical protein